MKSVFAANVPDEIQHSIKLLASAMVSRGLELRAQRGARQPSRSARGCRVVEMTRTRASTSC
jgi:hypothetical protein